MNEQLACSLNLAALTPHNHPRTTRSAVQQLFFCAPGLFPQHELPRIAQQCPPRVAHVVARLAVNPDLLARMCGKLLAAHAVELVFKVLVGRACQRAAQPY